MVFGCECIFCTETSGDGDANVQPIGIGAAYGTAKAGIGISGVGTFRSDLIMKVRITCGVLSLFAG